MSQVGIVQREMVLTLQCHAGPTDHFLPGGWRVARSWGWWRTICVRRKDRA